MQLNGQNFTFEDFKKMVFEIAKMNMSMPRSRQGQFQRPQPSISDRVNKGLSAASYISDATSGHPGTREHALNKYQTSIGNIENTRNNNWMMDLKAGQMGRQAEQQDFNNVQTMLNQMLNMIPQAKEDRPPTENEMKVKWLQTLTPEQLSAYFLGAHKKKGTNAPTIDVFGNINKEIGREEADRMGALQKHQANELNYDYTKGSNPDESIRTMRPFNYPKTDTSAIINRNVAYGASQGIKNLDSLRTGAYQMFGKPFTPEQDAWGRQTFPDWDELNDEDKLKILKVDYPGGN